MKKASLLLLLTTCLCLTLSWTACAPLMHSVQGLFNPTQTYAVFMPPTQALASPSEAAASLTPQPSATLQPSHTPGPSATPTVTASPTPPPPTPSPTWAWTKAGQAVTVPILLYHHIASDSGSSRYYVSVENFRQQMKALHNWGYTSITPSYLANVLMHGGELPARPVIISFDDGNLDVYSNAFPIMQKYGFVGTFYIVANRVGAYNLVNAEQLKEMAAAGWEIGSHSMTHMTLTTDYSQVRNEILQSRLTLEAAVGVPVRSFAYPFGLADEYIGDKTEEYGYTSGMGLGTLNEHTLGSLFYLSRREVQYGYDMNAFATLLPWTQPPKTP
mgnify:FL=1